MHSIRRGQHWEDRFLKRNRTSVIAEFDGLIFCLVTPRCKSSCQALRTRQSGNGKENQEILARKYYTPPRGICGQLGRSSSPRLTRNVRVCDVFWRRAAV